MRQLKNKIALSLVTIAVALSGAAGLAGCGADNGPESSTEPQDSATPDTSSPASQSDGAVTKDGSAPDSTVPDAAGSDGTVADVAVPDVAVVDVLDGALSDVAVSPEAAGPDTGADTGTSAEASVPEAGGGGQEASVPDASAPDTSVVDAAVPDSSTVTEAGGQDAATSAVGLVDPRTVPVTAGTPLAVASGAVLPANLAIEVPVDTLLRIGFDAAPTLGTTGTVSIHKVSDNSVVDTINIADPYAVYAGTVDGGTVNMLVENQTSTKVNVIGGLTTGVDQVRVVNYVPILVSGNTAIIVPHNNKLAYDTAYYVTIDAGLLAGNVSGTAFAGFSAPTDWTFTTKAAAPTTLNVAADNSADFATVQGAIDAIPAGSSAALTIHIAPGVYQEMLFDRNKKNVTLLGSNDGLGTIIQYDNCDGFNPSVGAAQTVTTPGAGGTIPGYGAAAGNLAGGGRAVVLTSGAGGLVMDSITLHNLHGQGSLVVPTLPAPTTLVPGASATQQATFVNFNSAVTQAETLYFNISFSATTLPGTLVAKHSNFVSYQDTLQLKGFSWFYDCFVTGDVDFIWGSPNAALFERSEIKTRVNNNGPAVVQSRAYLSIAGTTTTPATLNVSYPGFIFLNSALTKEVGTFTAYLARSPGPVQTSGASPNIQYLGYDNVSYIGCSMDTHIAAVGWNVVGGNPPGANASATPILGWREYKSTSPAGALLDVSQRLANPSPTATAAAPGGSIQLSDANVATFFANRATIFAGSMDGTFTTTGLAGFSPVP